MDEENMRDLKRKAPKGSTAQLLLFGDYDPEGDKIIRDPYYVCIYLSQASEINIFLKLLSYI